MKIVPYKASYYLVTLKMFEQYPEMFDEVDFPVIKQRLRESTSAEYPKYVAEENNRILGFIGYSKPWDSTDIWSLRWFVVDRAYRNQGIGKELLAYVEEKILASDCKQLYVETVGNKKKTNVDTAAFYKKRGFKKIGEIPKFYGNFGAKAIYYKELS